MQFLQCRNVGGIRDKKTNVSKRHGKYRAASPVPQSAKESASPPAFQQPPVLWLDSGKRVKTVSLEATYIVAAPITAAVKTNAHFHMTSRV